MYRKSAVPLSYCERVSSAEYEQQRHDVAHDALLQLLDDIIDNDAMTPSTKQRRLMQVSSVLFFCSRKMGRLNKNGVRW